MTRIRVQRVRRIIAGAVRYGPWMILCGHCGRDWMCHGFPQAKVMDMARVHCRSMEPRPGKPWIGPLLGPGSPDGGK